MNTIELRMELIMQQLQRMHRQHSDAKLHLQIPRGAEHDDLAVCSKIKAFNAFDESQNKLKKAYQNIINQATNNPEQTNAAALQEAMAQLEGAENRINTERRKFNQAVEEYNSYRNQIPQKFTARITGFKDHSAFDSSAN